MEFSFQSIKQTLDINHSRYLRVISHQKERVDESTFEYYSITNFISYEADHIHFADVFIFYMHVTAVDFIERHVYVFSDDFFSQKRIFEPISSEEFTVQIQIYFEQYKKTYDDNILEYDLQPMEIIQCFKVFRTNNDLHFVLTTKKHYFVIILPELKVPIV